MFSIGHWHWWIRLLELNKLFSSPQALTHTILHSKWTLHSGKLLCLSLVHPLSTWPSHSSINPGLVGLERHHSWSGLKDASQIPAFPQLGVTMNVSVQSQARLWQLTAMWKSAVPAQSRELMLIHPPLCLRANKNTTPSCSDGSGLSYSPSSLPPGWQWWEVGMDLS